MLKIHASRSIWWHNGSDPLLLMHKYQAKLNWFQPATIFHIIPTMLHIRTYRIIVSVSDRELIRSNALCCSMHSCSASSKPWPTESFGDIFNCLEQQIQRPQRKSASSPGKFPSVQIHGAKGTRGASKGHIWMLPSRELTYPTLGKGKTSSKCHFLGICQFPGGYLLPIKTPLSYLLMKFQSHLCCQPSSSFHFLTPQSWACKQTCGSKWHDYDKFHMHIIQLSS